MSYICLWISKMEQGDATPSRREAICLLALLHIDPVQLDTEPCAVGMMGEEAKR